MKTKVQLIIFTILMTIFWIEPSFAAGDLTSVSSTLTNQFKGLGGMIKVGGFLAGFIALLVGINNAIQAHKRQEGMGGPIATIVVAVLLLSAVTFAQVGSQSIFGEDGGVSELLN